MTTMKSGHASRKALYTIIFLTVALVFGLLFFISLHADGLVGEVPHQLGSLVTVVVGVSIIVLAFHLSYDLRFGQSRIEDLVKQYNDTERRCQDFRQLIKGVLEQEPDVEKSINAYLRVRADKFIKATTDRSVELVNMKLRGEEPGTGWLCIQERAVETAKECFWGAHAVVKAVGITVRKSVKDYVTELPKDGDTSVAARGNMHST